jgi:TPR repeat protein
MRQLAIVLAISLLIQTCWMPVDAPLVAAEPEPTAVDEQTEDPDALVRLGEGVAVDLSKALSFYRRALEAGSRTARLRVGEMVARGEGTPRNFEAGTRMIREVAAAGDGNAYFLLGELLSETGSSGNFDAAIEAYQEASRLGRDDAFIKLGDLFSSQPTADLPKAFRYYQQAAAVGSQTGKLRVGEMLIRGEGIGKDTAAGLALITEVADAGSVNGLMLLGDLHDGGPGSIADDLPKALQYYRRAASSDDPRALLALGDTLSKFDPDHEDGTGAIGAYERAAMQGSTDALLRLGDLFSGGRIVAINLSRAFVYYQRAGEAGSRSGQLRVAEMLARGQGASQDIEAGLRLVRHLAEKESRALLVLGDLLSRGDAGSIDGKAAVHAYEAAAEAGLTDAFLRLGDLYREGAVVGRRDRLAVDYYRRAADAGNPYGLYALGMFYLDSSIGSPEEAWALLDQAESAGIPDVTVVRADDLLASGDDGAALDLLGEAAAGGNLAAQLRLIEIYRDGAGSIRKDEAQARRHLADFKARSDRGAWLHETLLLDAAFYDSSSYEGIFASAGELAPRSRESLLRRLLNVNPNAYVYLVQSQLQRLGLYSGPKSGKLGRTTIEAVNRYCALKRVEQLCRPGPMSSQTARIMAGAFDLVSLGSPAPQIVP